MLFVKPEQYTVQDDYNSNLFLVLLYLDTFFLCVCEMPISIYFTGKLAWTLLFYNLHLLPEGLRLF